MSVVTDKVLAPRRTVRAVVSGASHSDRCLVVMVRNGC